MKRAALLKMVVMLLLPVLSQAEEAKYIFEHMQTSNHWINDIYQDRDGFMWVSARSGLYRYHGDGSADYEVISEGKVFYDISQDADGVMWLMSSEGLVSYDPATCRMMDVSMTSEILSAQNWVNCFEISDNNDFWWNESGSIYVRSAQTKEKVLAGVCEGGVCDLHIKNGIVHVLTEKGTIYRFSLDSTGIVIELPPLMIHEHEVDYDHGFQHMFVDSSQSIWVSQGAYGVWLCRNGGKDILHLYHGQSDNSIQRGYINSIIEDTDGNIWLSSDHGGISVCDKTGKVLSRLVNHPTDGNSLASNSIYTLYCDDSGNVWVGYTKNGLSIYRGKNKVWSMLHVRSLHERNLNDDINSTCEDAEGNIWLGTDGYGLIKLDPETGEETLYTSDNSCLGSNVITDIHCDHKGRIWVGTFYGGLSCIEDNRIRTWRYGAEDSFLASDNIWSIDHDAEGRIWLGTLGGGVQSYDPESGEVNCYRSGPGGLSNDAVHDIDCTEDGKVYVATAYGLSIIDSHTGNVDIVVSDNMTLKSIINVMRDSRGLVWLNEDGILQVYDPKKGTFHTPHHQSLNAVRGIMEGYDNMVWAITDNGMCRLQVYRSVEDGYAFDVVSFSFPQCDNLHFNQRSVCMTSDGDFIVGSYCGFMRFRQDQFAQQNISTDVNVRLTGLYLGNQKIEPGQEYNGSVILDKALGYTDNVRLSHDISVVSVAFSCLDYFSVIDTPLYYRMVGISPEWIRTEGRAGKITFTNLRPGRYRLYITSDTSDLSKSILLSIRVMPPWWLSWWAIVLYVSVLAAAAFIGNRIYIKRKIEKQIRLEQAIKQERRHYVDEMKMQFFTNVSHDFRTPLTLIMTPIEDLLEKHPDKRGDTFLMTIYRNAQKLLNLVNEVLDLRKMEMYGSHLNLASADLVVTVKETVDSFMLMAESQGITLGFESEPETLVFDFDSAKISKVLTNLLSNAFKFTPQGGCITVEVSLSGNENVFISVKDTGCGIPDKAKRRIFDRFYQLKNSPAGSGIGLHVVNEFVLLHGGEVSVSDNIPVGTVFTVNLPVRFIAEDVEYMTGGRYDNLSAGPENVSDKRSTILIADDNDDFRAFMCASLGEEYNVLSASDGAEALKVVEANDIDVVISDVMMPGIDGNEFCRKMKSDINTSHIPIILLTAKMMKEDECYGLESGADDYLTKPFNMSILRLRVAKFIEWKKRAKRIFENELEVTTDQITITTLDDRLLQQAINIINENIANPDFSVADLSSALCMHRTSLYKKLVYITGKTPVEFIRSMRLKRAASLLLADGVYISEIAFMVGFNSPKVFAGHFKDEFGCSPTEYRRLNRDDNPEVKTE